MIRIEKILITIDKKIIHEYNSLYLNKHPRSNNIPFATKVHKKLYNKDGTPKLTRGGNPKSQTKTRTRKEYTIDDALYGAMSLNEILIINNRMTMNGIKDKWGQLGIWLANKYNLSNKQISNSLIEFRIFSHTKAKKDLDNLSAGIKFLNDGLFVKSKMFIDDNYFHINPLIIIGDYDKNNPRTEIRITTFNNDTKNPYIKLQQHINYWNS